MKSVPSGGTNGHYKTDVFTYFVVGHDVAESLADDALLRESKDKDLDFLFGGIGDARHLFATLMYLFKAERRLNLRKDRLYRFTAVDVAPQALARDSVLLSLLDDLSKVPKEDRSAREQILLTVCYVNAAPVMPAWIYDDMQRAISNVADQMRASNPKANSPVQRALVRWRQDTERLFPCSWLRTSAAKDLNTKINYDFHEGHLDAPEGCDIEKWCFMATGVLMPPHCYKGNDKGILKRLVEEYKSAYRNGQAPFEGSTVLRGTCR